MHSRKKFWTAKKDLSISRKNSACILKSLKFWLGIQLSERLYSYFGFVNAAVLWLFVQVQKLAITVELLLGDIPDRAIFRQPSIRKTLAPYFQLTQGRVPLLNSFWIFLREVIVFSRVCEDGLRSWNAIGRTGRKEQKKKYVLQGMWPCWNQTRSQKKLRNTLDLVTELMPQIMLQTSRPQVGFSWI